MAYGAPAREGETVERSPGKGDLERHSMSRKARGRMMPGGQLMSRFTLPTPRQHVSQLQPSIFCFSLSVPPITVKVTASGFGSELGWCLQVPL